MWGSGGVGVGGGGSRAEKVCVLKTGLSFLALYSKLHGFPRGKVFWFWVRFWFGLSEGVRLITPYGYVSTPVKRALQRVCDRSIKDCWASNCEWPTSQKHWRRRPCPCSSGLCFSHSSGPMLC